MDTLLNKLAVPIDLAKEEVSQDRLDAWRRDVLLPTLARLQEWQAKSGPQLTLEDRAALSYALTAFDCDAPWTNEESRTVAHDVLQLHPPVDTALLKTILLQHIKPIFLPTPHPLLNEETGRKRPNGPAGGPLAAQDHYEGQKWKENPAISYTLTWCLGRCDAAILEDIWHLIVPPVMTFLDDYETSYKLRGIKLASELVERASSSLLRRTGIDSLISASYQTALTHLHDPLSPVLIRAAVHASLQLTERTTSPGSAGRFDRFCAVLGKGIIGTVWMYAAREQACIDASVEALPEVVLKFGIGSARYLKAIIPQLIHPLMPYPVLDAPIITSEILYRQLISLRALSVVLDVCAVRAHYWKGTVIDGVGRCWVTIADAEEKLKTDKTKTMDGALGEQVKRELRAICVQLAKACPPVVENEYARLSAVSPIFASLFKGITAPPILSDDL